jgi:hypothetical protein
MNVGLFALFLFGVALTGYAVSRMNDVLEVPDILICGISLYLLGWCIVAVCLVLVNSFKPVLALSLAMALPLLALLVLEPRDSRPLFKKLSIGKDILIITLFLVVMLPVVYQRYEYIEQNGDAGVYSVMAMHIVKDGTLRAALPIREKLSEQKKELFDQNNTLPGAIFLPAANEIQYQFYPGWPVMMALWGGIFGLENQHYVMIVLYLLVVFLFYSIVRLLTPHTFLPVFITITFGCSPLLVHFTKYPTSELFLLFLVLFCSFNLLQNKLSHAIIAGFAAGAYFLTHISYFMYLPFFAITMMLAYLWKNEGVILFCLTAFVGYLLSVPYGLFVSKEYFHLTYRDQFEPFFHRNDSHFAIYSLVILSAVMAMVALLLFVTLRNKSGARPQKNMQNSGAL